MPLPASEHSVGLEQGTHVRFGPQIGAASVGHWLSLQHTWQLPSAQRFGLACGQAFEHCPRTHVWPLRQQMPLQQMLLGHCEFAEHGLQLLATQIGLLAGQFASVQQSPLLQTPLQQTSPSSQGLSSSQVGQQGVP